ncbi:MAG: hypothetical protein ACOC5I_01605 [Gemmatimonadota bacterium]
MTEHNEDVLRCRRCGREAAPDEVDRLLWCEDCVLAERSRAAWWGRGIALVTAGLLALWIAVQIRPGDRFRILWALVLIVAYLLIARLAHELVYGVRRVRNRSGARSGERGSGEE